MPFQEPWVKANPIDLARYCIPRSPKGWGLPVNDADHRGSPEGHEKLARTIYETLAKQEILYAPALYHWVAKEQLIRKPDEILDRPNQGTCLDLSLLFAGLCLHHQLLPLIVVLDWHAFAAVCLSQAATDPSMYGRAGDDVFGEGNGLALPGKQKDLEALFANGFLPIECTGFARWNNATEGVPEADDRDSNGRLRFDQAVAAAKKQLSGARSLLFALDIERVQRRGVGPSAEPVGRGGSTGRLWTIPLTTANFQDRPDLITRIDQSLARHPATALTALHGLGGIGKTQLALRYAQLRRERYAAGAWLAAESDVSLLGSLAALAPLLGVAREQDQEAMAARVIQELCAREPWLVVFDNAESREALRPWVRRLSGKGHVLITSRGEEWDGVAAPVSVSQWSIEESVKFLLERTGQSDGAAAESLARDLDGLVLALEHAASSMRAGDRMALGEYHRIWRERLARTPRGHEYPDSVAATLGLSIDRARAESEAAYDLLCLFAWLAPDRIPRKELLEAGASRLPEKVAAAWSDPDAWAEVVETLARHSLVQRDEVDGVVVGHRVHRVVQQVVRDRHAAEGSADRWFTAACDLVNAAFPYKQNDLATWAASDLLLPHVRAIRERVGSKEAPALGRLLNEASLYLRVRGLHAAARDFIDLALKSALRQLGPDHPNVAVYRSNLANILGDLGEHGEARKQIELALESALRQFGPDHPAIATRRNNLAHILVDLGERAEALRQFDLALEILRKTMPPGHPNVQTIQRSRDRLARDLASEGWPA